MSRTSLVPAFVFFAPLLVSAAEDARKIIEEAQRRAKSDSQRYEGILQVLDQKNRITEKRWRYDRIGSAGNSKTVLRFTAPPEVKGVALLVVNHSDRASDQWMWTPAIARDRRIALQDRSTRFFGTDFSFEDLEERDVDQYEYRLLGEETSDGVECYKIESRPRETRSSQYTRSLVWIRKDYMAFHQVEGYNKERLIRRIKYRKYERVQNIWTPLEIEVADIGRNSRTLLKTEKLQYNVPMKDEDFTVQALRRES